MNREEILKRKEEVLEKLGPDGTQSYRTAYEITDRGLKQMAVMGMMTGAAMHHMAAILQANIDLMKELCKEMARDQGELDREEEEFDMIHELELEALREARRGYEEEQKKKGP